ncbi:MAG: carbohydrate ABC transporter substrate-binding protein, partial [Spirochaetales bacterium]
DINAILTTRVQAGNPPDIAILPNPGTMVELARDGKLVNLGEVYDMADFRKNFSQGWIDLGTVDGKLYGVYLKAAIKGLVWYNPVTVASLGISLPKTWDELQMVSQKAIAAGISPWAIGVESGAASGWVGTDWIENIFLRINGPKLYKDWYEGRLAWTSPEVKKAFQYFGQVVGDPKMAYGGKAYILSTNFGAAHAPLFQTPPKALFHQQASFLQSFIKEQFPALTVGKDFSFFGFPAIDSRYAKAVEGAGDCVVALKPSAAAAEFLKFLASAEGQTYWAATGALSTNRTVPLTAYTDPLTKEAARILNESEMVVFDASDMMPGAMNEAFWGAIMSFVNDPASLDKILADLDKVRMDAYKK